MSIKTRTKLLLNTGGLNFINDWRYNLGSPSNLRPDDMNWWPEVDQYLFRIPWTLPWSATSFLNAVPILIGSLLAIFLPKAI